MKKLNLNETWEKCLDGMWKWVIERVRVGDVRNVDELKGDWLDDNNFEDYIEYDCFFCDYAKTHLSKKPFNPNRLSCYCESCPAVKIDKTFDCLANEYHYARNPIKFYKELVRLNKIRLTRKK